jgi:hypothetical protein
MYHIDPESLNVPLEATLRRRKMRRRWAMLVFNLVLWFVVVMAAWGEAQSTPQLREMLREGGKLYGALVMLTLGWGFALLIQIAVALMDSGVGERRLRARLLRHEIGDLVLGQMQTPHKVKAKRHLEDDALTIDEEGELVPLDEPHSRGGASR